MGTRFSYVGTDQKPVKLKWFPISRPLISHFYLLGLRYEFPRRGQNNEKNNQHNEGERTPKN
jgi:hypothetical protein